MSVKDSRRSTFKINIEKEKMNPDKSRMDYLKDTLTSKLAELTGDLPAFIHLDMLGLAKTARNNEDRLAEFLDILTDTEKKGGNFCIPSYSLSYTRNEEYIISDTECVNVGAVSEFIRKNFPKKRTVDALFSYLIFGDKISKKHYEVNDYESFGTDSLIGEVFRTDGYIWAIGGVFKNSTEIHFIEKLLQVSYRYDKIFKGKLTDNYGKKHDQKVTYFCKNFDYNLWYDFKNLENDLREDGLMETIKTDGYPFFITGIKFSTLYEYIEHKIRKDYKYFIKDLKDRRL